jgi:hypothetical protein
VARGWVQDEGKINRRKPTTLYQVRHISVDQRVSVCWHNVSMQLHTLESFVQPLWGLSAPAAQACTAHLAVLHQQRCMQTLALVQLAAAIGAISAL